MTRIKGICYECWYFDPRLPREQHYRCAVPGSCPGLEECPREQCDGYMKLGIAIGLDHGQYERLENVVLINDPVLAKCLKCNKCGHSTDYIR